MARCPERVSVQREAEKAKFSGEAAPGGRTGRRVGRWELPEAVEQARAAADEERPAIAS